MIYDNYSNINLYQVTLICMIVAILSHKIIRYGIKRTDFKSQNFIPIAIVTIGTSWFLSLFQLHLKFLYWFSLDFRYVSELRSLGIFINFLAILCCFLIPFFWFRGIIPAIHFIYYQSALDKISLKNAKGESPKVVDIKKIDSYHQVVTVLAEGIGIEQLTKNRSKLESVFSNEISEISTCRDRSYVKITLSTKELPNSIDFCKVEHHLKSDGYFLLGESKQGIVGSKLTKLPHLLIAGTTGMGKSICFKQIILGLLLSTSRIQIYLIDLKGGIEFRDFNSLPNIKMVKTIEDAVALLQKVKAEMLKRFRYLEQTGNSKINFKRDNLDYIVVGIDESSVLYANSRRDAADYQLIKEARELTEEIAKLSRASGISLILATQKVTKETIDTRIQENISGRIAFKLNTPEGSVRILGNGAANHLDAIPGRGIWQFGSKQVEIQVPYLSGSYLKSKLKEIEQEFEYGKRKVPSKMLSIDDYSQNKLTTIQHLIQKENKAYEQQSIT